MQRIFTLLAISLFLCSTATAAQGGGGESTKIGSSKKKEVSKKTSSGAKAANSTPPKKRPGPLAPKVYGDHASLAIDLGNGVKLELVLITSGSFQMGSEENDNEKPMHIVKITQTFYMGKYEVTQGQWQAVMDDNPSTFKGENLPVETVSWDDAIAFIAKLNAQNDGYSFRLPTEAEWEYACRAGTSGDYAGAIDATAWYGNNSGRARLDAAEIYRTDSENISNRITANGGQTHAVGSKLPNSFGLFDMHGNVWEWCQDWYHDDYDGAPNDGSAWLTDSKQKYRVLRGGSWINFASRLRSALRHRYTPDYRNSVYGFRVVAVVRTQ